MLESLDSRFRSLKSKKSDISRTDAQLEFEIDRELSVNVESNPIKFPETGVLGNSFPNSDFCNEREPSGIQYAYTSQKSRSRCLVNPEKKTNKCDEIILYKALVE